MPSIIRATDQNLAIAAREFNFDDMAAQAGRYLDKVRADAAKIVAQAQAEAAAIRRRAEGEGRKAAMQSVEKIVSDQMAAVLPALRQAIQEIQYAKQAWLRHWEASAVHVAAAMARKIIRAELSRQPNVPLALVRDALELAAGNTNVRIRLNPADHKVIAAQVKALIEEMSALTAAEVIADPAISSGGCRLETAFGVIDQQIESQLARIGEELT